MLQATTIVCVRRGDQVAIAGDGQVTLQETIMKNTAKKVRSLRNGKVLGGFAGSASDGMTAPPWNWPATGAPTRCCANWKP